MTPKEKAKELVEKFRNEFKWVEKDHNVDLYRDTRQCALIAVDEILDLMIKTFKWDINHNGNIDYWKEVKKEIQKL